METLIAGALSLGITLNRTHVNAFERYYLELESWNLRFNLTAITDRHGVMIRHFLDSLSCLRAISPAELSMGACVIDVGTGAGFPGIPLKIVCPGMRLTLLEATNKKVAFLEHIVETLRLRDVSVVNSRAEELGQDATHRERYDWALARAVAELSTLAEYLLPLVAVDGHALAQKGESAAAETHNAHAAITTLGGQVRQLVPVELRGLAETRFLVVLDKIAATPSKYPRRPGMPSKRPL